MIRRLAAALVLVAATVGISVAVLPSALAASEPPVANGLVTKPWTLSLVGDRGHYIAGGLTKAYSSSSTSMSMQGASYSVNLYVGAAGDPDGLSLHIGTGSATPLHVGVYEFGSGPSGPSFSLSGFGRGCPESGRFEIRDVAFDSKGYFTRLDLRYEDHCSPDTTPAAFGELRIGEPVPAGLAATPTAVTWAGTYAPNAATTVPVTFRATDTTRTVGSVVVGGRTPVRSPCSATAARRRFWPRAPPAPSRPRSSPTGGGPRTASLIATDTKGRSTSVQTRRPRGRQHDEAVVQRAGRRVHQPGQGLLLHPALPAPRGHGLAPPA